MKDFDSISKSCGKEYSVLTADMAIYLLTKVIQMQPVNPFPKLIMRIGKFHLQKIWLHCLGQYLEGCGIEEILDSDLELYNKGTLKSIFSGLQYNREVQIHKLIYESVRTLQIFEFSKSCNKSNLIQFLLISQYDALRKCIADGDKIKVREIFQDVCQCNEAKEFFKNFNNFLKTRCEENEVFLFFNIYCEMVELLLDSIRSD